MHNAPTVLLRVVVTAAACWVGYRIGTNLEAALDALAAIGVGYAWGTWVNTTPVRDGGPSE